MKKEVKLLRAVQRYLDDFAYPGYPFAANGIVDMETQQCWMGPRGGAMKFENFMKEFDSMITYQVLGSNLATKGSFLVDSKMSPVKEFLEAEYDDFYIDSIEATKLYFAFYAAYRAAKNTKSFIFYQCDCDCCYTNVEIFCDDAEGTALSKIKKFIKDIEMPKEYLKGGK